MAKPYLTNVVPFRLASLMFLNCVGLSLHNRIALMFGLASANAGTPTYCLRGMVTVHGFTTSQSADFPENSSVQRLAFF